MWNRGLSDTDEGFWRSGIKMIQSAACEPLQLWDEGQAPEMVKEQERNADYKLASLHVQVRRCVCVCGHVAVDCVCVCVWDEGNERTLEINVAEKQATCGMSFSGLGPRMDLSIMINKMVTIQLLPV